MTVARKVERIESVYTKHCNTGTGNALIHWCRN